MQQHLGQHVLSGCFYKLFNANTFAIHLGNDISTVDIEGTLTEEQIRKAESYANEVINEGLTVEFLIPTKKELKSFTLRRALPNTKEDISVVKIGDLDINACCGVHPRNTRDLRMIKIKKNEKPIRMIAIKQYKNFLAKPEGKINLGLVTKIVPKNK